MFSSPIPAASSYIPSSGGRTLLLFVIRDHIGVTPLANLQSTLTADLLRIWDGLSKPSELKERQLSDYFDLEFTTLPHKILVPEQFEAGVQSLRQRFVQKNSPGYLFKPAYHKRIPADGVAYYMEGIWVSLIQGWLSLSCTDTILNRNKSNQIRILTCLRSKSFLHNFVAMRFPQLRSLNSMNRASHKKGL